MELREFIDLKVNKVKFDKIKKIYKSQTDQEIIDQILDDILYMTDMLKHSKKYEGKGNLKKIYV
jgi:hypothetical protein